VVVGAADPSKLGAVVAEVDAEIAACDIACSRFRDDSELSRINAGETLPRPSEWFCDALATAIEAAALTDGLVDPTVGQLLVDFGYDRTFDSIDRSAPLTVTASHTPAWHRIEVDRERRRVSVGRRVRLDLGATAKALCSDRAARRASEATGTGVLVSLGGDISAAGEAPAEGWVILVTDRCDTDPSESGAGQTVAIRGGGLATSGTSSRRWSRGGRDVHHLFDPRSSAPAEEVWRTVSVAAPSCVLANTASTAAMILGAGAPDWLKSHGFDSRLVAADGRVLTTGAWPLDAATNTERAMA
jgi:thiamine biosynthesis lipoprotein